MVEKVVILALESGVGLLLNLENNITRHDARKLVTFTAELDLVAILDTTINVDVKDLALDNSLLTMAVAAAVLVTDILSFTIAVGTDSLEALNHGTHLAHHRLHTGTVTASTCLDSALLTTTTVASRTDDGLLESQLGYFAAVDIFQVDLVDVVNGASLLGALIPHTTAEHAAETTAAAEELGEEILRAHSTGTATAFKTLFTKLVVDVTLLRIGENFVRLGHFLECFSGLWVVGVLVCTKHVRIPIAPLRSRLYGHLPGWYLRAPFL